MPATPFVHVVANARDSPLWQVVNEYFPKLVDCVIARYRFILAREHDVDIKRLIGGTVTSIQRAGSALQATPHSHTAATDGVYLVSDDEPPAAIDTERRQPEAAPGVGDLTANYQRPVP